MTDLNARFVATVALLAAVVFVIISAAKYDALDRRVCRLEHRTPTTIGAC